MSSNLIEIRRIDAAKGRFKFTGGKIPLLGSALNEPTVRALQWMAHDYSGPTTDTSTTIMGYQPNIILYVDAL